jgi:hypothetical protein
MHAYTLFEFSCFHSCSADSNSVNSVWETEYHTIRRGLNGLLLIDQPCSLHAMHAALTCWFCRYRAATAMPLPIRCLEGTGRPAGSKFISRVRQAKLGRTGQLQIRTLACSNHSGLDSWLLLLLVYNCIWHLTDQVVRASSEPSEHISFLFFLFVFSLREIFFVFSCRFHKQP